MLILKQEDYNKIVDHAKKGLPNEACGLLGGYVEGDKRVVTDVYLLRNVDESREHFSMDPAADCWSPAAPAIGIGPPR